MLSALKAILLIGIKQAIGQSCDTPVPCTYNAPTAFINAPQYFNIIEEFCITTTGSFICPDDYFNYSLNSSGGCD